MHLSIRCLAAVLFFAVAVVARAQIDERVEGAYGEFRGQESETNPGVMTFLGIPYAEPPVEENRWRPPVPITNAKRVRAEAFGNRCPQPPAAGGGGGRFGMPGGRGGFAGQFGGGGGGGGMRGGGGGGRGGGGFGGIVMTNEDCLFLNVWTGVESASAKAPVMVWIGGEELLRGAGSDANNSGEALATRGIVVVNFNYRLGAFGFLAHPELTAETGTSGNYGLMDAIVALKWVKANIEGFGGDPDNITVFSGSAGAVMTAALIGSPEAKGLFQKAILQSGSWMGTGISRMQTLAEAEDLGTRLLAQFEERDGERMALEDIRELPIGQLTSILAEPQIIVDGRYIPRDLSRIFASGEQNGVDVIVGSNREEGVTFAQRRDAQTAGDYEAAVRDRLGGLANDYLRLYPSGTVIDDAVTAGQVALASTITALGDEMAWQMRLLAENQTEIGRSSYVYEFTRVPPPTGAPDDRPASVHAAELPYVFNIYGPQRQWTGGDRQLGQVIASYWINFAETGNPNGSHRWQEADLPLWPLYRGSEEFQTIEFGDRVGTNPAWQLLPEKLELFDRIYSQLILGGTN